MNEELQNALAEFISATMIDGKEFVLSEAPEVIHQFLMWGMVQHGIIYFTTFIISYVLAKIAKRLYDEKDKRDWPEEWILPAFLSFIASLGVALISLGELLYCLQIWIAPKVYLIEYAASLAK